MEHSTDPGDYFFHVGSASYQDRTEYQLESIITFCSIEFWNQNHYNEDCYLKPYLKDVLPPEVQGEEGRGEFASEEKPEEVRLALLAAGFQEDKSYSPSPRPMILSLIIIPKKKPLFLIVILEPQLD